MARIAGYGGSFTFNTLAVGITEWEVNAEGEALDATGMDSAGVAAYIKGITRWSGRAAGKWDSDEALIHGDPPAATDLAPGNTGTVHLNISTGAAHDYEGSIIITALRVTAPLEGIITWEVTFQGTGALTYPVDTTP